MNPLAMNSSSETIHLECEVHIRLGGKLEQPSLVAQVGIVLIIIINIIIFPFTVLLNALVMIAVKIKRRLRIHKSNIVIALLATTDFATGMFVQPVFTAWLIAILLNYKSKLCPVDYFGYATSCLLGASILHLTLVSGERYLAMKHPFAHSSIIKEANLLVASALAWLLVIILNVLLYFMQNNNAVVLTSNAFITASIAIIAFCHLKVYHETRRHKRQIAAQQVTQEAKKQFLKDQRAFKVTSLIIGVLILCTLPLVIGNIIIFKFPRQVSLEGGYLISFSMTSICYFVSFINPIIYSVRIKEFRVAFSEMMCRSKNLPHPP